MPNNIPANGGPRTRANAAQLCAKPSIVPCSFLCARFEISALRDGPESAKPTAFIAVKI